LNASKQFASSPINKLNSLVKKQLVKIATSNIAYRNCRSFKYDNGGLMGFRIGFTDTPHG